MFFYSFDEKSAETTKEKKTTKSEQIETTKEIKPSIPLIPQTLPEHQLNNAYIPPPSRIPSAIPSTINGKSPKIPLKFSSSNRKTSSNNCVKPPPLPPRPPPQINGQSNGTTPVMKESFLTVMAAKRKAASGIARRQKQNGRQVFEKWNNGWGFGKFEGMSWYKELWTYDHIGERDYWIPLVKDLNYILDVLINLSIIFIQKFFQFKGGGRQIIINW